MKPILQSNSEFFEYINRATGNIERCYYKIENTPKSLFALQIGKLNRFEEKNKDVCGQIIEHNKKLKETIDNNNNQKIEKEILSFAKTKNII